MKDEPRVLIIEDNDALRVMLFTVLCHQPLEVDTAASAEEALEKVTTCDYALILVDMNLRENDGPVFLRRFRHEARAAVQGRLSGQQRTAFRQRQTPPEGQPFRLRHSAKSIRGSIAKTLLGACPAKRL